MDKHLTIYFLNLFSFLSFLQLKVFILNFSKFSSGWLSHVESKLVDKLCSENIKIMYGHHKYSIAQNVRMLTLHKINVKLITKFHISTH